MADLQFPTETIDLPSKGWFYPEGHPLASGQMDVYLMTAKHEDILTSRNLIQKGIVIDKLMEALIVPPVRYDDLLIGDKNALILATRILGYGKEYEVSMVCPACGEENECVIDLEKLEERDVPFENSQKGKNAFDFVLPLTKKKVTFKLLTHKEELAVEADLRAMKKLRTDIDPEVTTRMAHSIIAVDGVTDRGAIKTFVDNMPIRDARALREYGRTISPDIEFKSQFVCPSCDVQDVVEVPLGAGFFWPKL